MSFLGWDGGGGGGGGVIGITVSVLKNVVFLPVVNTLSLCTSKI